MILINSKKRLATLLIVFVSGIIIFILGCSDSSEVIKEEEESTNIFIFSTNGKSFCNNFCDREIFEIKEFVLSQNQRKYTFYVNPSFIDMQALSAFRISLLYNKEVFEIADMMTQNEGRFECRSSNLGINCFWLNTISYNNILVGVVELMDVTITKKNNLPSIISVEVQLDGGNYLSIDQKASDNYIF